MARTFSSVTPGSLTAQCATFIGSLFLTQCSGTCLWGISYTNRFLTKFGSSCPPTELLMLTLSCIPFCPRSSAGSSFCVRRCLGDGPGGSWWIGRIIRRSLSSFTLLLCSLTSYKGNLLLKRFCLSEKFDRNVCSKLELHCEVLAEYVYLRSHNLPNASSEPFTTQA